MWCEDRACEDKVKEVLVDGVSVGAVESYTFENITQNTSISVKFEKID